MHIFCTYVSIVYKKEILIIIDTFVLHFSGTKEYDLFSNNLHLLIIHSLLIVGTIPTGRVHTVHIVSVVDTHEVGQDIYGHREDSGAVVLGRNAIECLQITQLKRRKY